MALVDEVQARYGTQYLVELSNPANSGASTIDTTRLANAAADTEAYFQIHAGIEYDNSNAQHVSVGVEGVETFLTIYKDRGAERRASLRNEFIERLKDMSKVGARDKITPTTTSNLTPSEEVQSGQRVRPYFDNEKLKDYVPDSDLRDNFTHPE